MTIEQTQAEMLVRLLLDAGYGLGVHDGEEQTLTNSTDYDAVMDALFTVDDDTLTLHYPCSGEYVGSVLLIHGNGKDMISDYGWLRAYCDTVEPDLDRITAAVWDATQE